MFSQAIVQVASIDPCGSEPVILTSGRIAVNTTQPAEEPTAILRQLARRPDNQREAPPDAAAVAVSAYPCGLAAYG